MKGRRNKAPIKLILFMMALIIMLTACSKSQEESVQPAAQVQSESNTREDIPYENNAVQYDTLFDNSTLHHLKIVITQEEWNGLSEDMLEYLSIYNDLRTKNYRKADLYYSDENGETIIQDVGIRTKGNTSRVLPEEAGTFHRFNFKLKFDETFDLEKDTPEYDTRKDRVFAGLSELNIKANLESDSTNTREIFCYDLENAYGVMASKASLATLTIVINGVEHNYGVVRFIEPVDKAFLEKRFGKKSNDGNLYKCLWQNYGPATLMPIEQQEAIGVQDWNQNYRPAYDLKTNKDEKNYQDLLSFIDNLNKLSGDELKAYLDNNFEIDRFIRAMSLDVLLGNLDGYRSMGNNYYLYFNESNKIEWIPYDFDNILGAGWDGSPEWNLEGIVNADIYEWYNLNAYMYRNDATHPLIDKVLQIDEYKETYIKYMNELIAPENNYFSYKRFTDMYDQLYKLYGDSVNNEMQENNTWGYNNEEWYFTTKIMSVQQQLAK